MSSPPDGQPAREAPPFLPTWTEGPGSFAASQFLPRKPVFTSRGRVVDKTPVPVLMQTQVARGSTVFLSAHPARFLPQHPGPRGGRQQAGQRWHSCHHNGPKNSLGVPRPTRLLVAQAPSALQGADSRFPRTGPGGLTWMMTPGCPHLDDDPFRFVLRLQCLGKRAHESLGREGEAPQAPAGLSPSAAAQVSGASPGAAALSQNTALVLMGIRGPFRGLAELPPPARAHLWG